MNTENNNALSVSPELAALLSNTPLVSDLDLNRLGNAVRELDNDPKWRAEFLKGRFVEHMLAAIEEESANQTSIANAWGKSRQYVSKLLNEDKRVNFTIETMCELAHWLHRCIDIQVLRTNEISQVLRCVPVTREVMNPATVLLDGKPVIHRPELFPFSSSGSQTIQMERYDESHLAA